MLNKIVYFIENPSRISGVQAIIPDILSNIPEDSNVEAYYINIASGTQYEKNNTSLRFIDLNECDFSQFEDAVFVVPANYLLFLLPYISELKKARLCLYIYDSLCYKRFIGKLDKPDQLKLAELLDSTKSMIYVNNKYVGVWEHGLVVYDRQIIPHSESSNVPDIPSKTAFDPTEINIGWVGAITPAALECISGIADELYQSFYPEQTEDQSDMVYPVKFIFHIIGFGKIMWNMNFPKYSPLIRFTYTGNLSDEDMQTYIIENLDLVAAYNANAIKCAMCGVPTIIPAIDNEPKRPLRKYVYFYDAKHYILCWKKEELHKLRNCSYTLKHIIEHLCDDNIRTYIGSECRKAAYEKYSYESNVKKLFSLAENTTLTVGICLDEPSIRGTLNQFNDYRKSIGNENASFGDYVAYKYPAAQPNVPDSTSKKTFGELLKKHLPDSIKYPKYYQVQKSYHKKERRIHRKYKKTGKIKVGFIVVFNSVFPERPVFEKMLDDDVLDPYIIIAPNVSKTYRYMMSTYDEAYNNLSAEYPGRVVGGYDEKSDTYLELKDEYSVIFFANPYKHLVHQYHEIEYFLDKDVLPLYANYGLAVVRFWEEVIATDFYNYLWKVCLETKGNLEFLKSKEIIKGKNGIVTGCLKMDKLASQKPRPDKTRKMIMICPHHTVWGWKALNISNFLEYYQLFVDLPKMYPQIDFVFRPHPLLFANLKAHKIWTQEQIDKYLEEMLSSDNIIYDTTGDYHEVFANSDAMIHDCASFTGEYLYTEKPCCYMLKKGVELSDTYIPLGEQCLENYYHAYNADDICQFIDDVVLGGNDPLKEQREKFAREELKVNYPHTSEFIMDVLKEKLT